MKKSNETEGITNDNEYSKDKEDQKLQNETSHSSKISNGQLGMDNNHEEFNNQLESPHKNNDTEIGIPEKDEKVAETPSGVLPGMEGAKASSNLIFTNKNQDNKDQNIYNGVPSSEAKKSGITMASSNGKNVAIDNPPGHSKKKNDDVVYTNSDISYSYAESYSGNEGKQKRETSNYLKDTRDERSGSDSNSRVFTTYSPTPKSMIATRMLPEKGSVLELPSPIITSPQGPTINTVPPNINDLTGISTDAPDEPIAVASRDQKQLELSMYNDLGGTQNSVVPRLPIDDYSPLGDYQNMAHSNSDSPTSIFKDNGRVSINSITCSANQGGRKSHKNTHQLYQGNEEDAPIGSANAYMGRDANISGRTKNYLTSPVTGSGRLLTVEYSRAKTVLEDLQGELKKIEEDNRNLKNKLSALQHEEELLGGLVYVLRNSTYKWDGSEENIYWD